MDDSRKEIRRLKRIALNEGDYYDMCRICEIKKSAHKMLFHHRMYIENDVIYNKYPNSSEGRIEYYQNLIPLIIKNPERFWYLCISCHKRLERFLKQGKRIRRYARVCIENPRKYDFTNEDKLPCILAICELGFYDQPIIDDINKFDYLQVQMMKIKEPEYSKHVGLDEFFWS